MNETPKLSFAELSAAIGMNKSALGYLIEKTKARRDEILKRMIQAPYTEVNTILGCKAELSAITVLLNEIALDLAINEGKVNPEQSNTTYQE